MGWEVTKRNHCFLKKKNGKAKRKGNIRSLNKFKYSGIANSKVFDVVSTDDNKAQLVIKNASKAGQSPAKGVTTIALNKSGFRKVEKTIKNSTDNVYYRKDLPPTPWRNGTRYTRRT